MLGPLTALLFVATQAGTAPGQLLITNARVLDVRTGAVAPRCTVLIENGIISRVVSDSQARASRLSAADTLNARGRLLTMAPEAWDRLPTRDDVRQACAADERRRSPAVRRGKR